MKRRLAVLATTAVAAGLAAVVPAAAADTSTQTVIAALGSSVAITTQPTALVDLGTLPSVGTTNGSGGSLTVTANVPYTLTVAADKAALTKFDSGTYTDAVKLTTPLALVPTLSSGVGVPVPVPAIGTTALPVASGTGLTTDTYALAFAQVTVLADVPASYRTVLTYTAAAVL